MVVVLFIYLKLSLSFSQQTFAHASLCMRRQRTHQMEKVVLIVNDKDAIIQSRCSAFIPRRSGFVLI